MSTESEKAFMDTLAGMLKEGTGAFGKHPKTVEVETYFAVLNKAKDMYHSDTDSYAKGWQDAIEFVETCIGVSSEGVSVGLNGNKI